MSGYLYRSVVHEHWRGSLPQNKVADSPSLDDIACDQHSPIRNATPQHSDTKQVACNAASSTPVCSPRLNRYPSMLPFARSDRTAHHVSILQDCMPTPSNKLSADTPGAPGRTAARITCATWTQDRGSLTRKALSQMESTWSRCSKARATEAFAERPDRETQKGESFLRKQSFAHCDLLPSSDSSVLHVRSPPHL